MADCCSAPPGCCLCLARRMLLLFPHLARILLACTRSSSGYILNQLRCTSSVAVLAMSSRRPCRRLVTCRTTGPLSHAILSASPRCTRSAAISVTLSLTLTWLRPALCPRLGRHGALCLVLLWLPLPARRTPLSSFSPLGVVLLLPALGVGGQVRRSLPWRRWGRPCLRASVLRDMNQQTVRTPGR